MSKPPKAAKGAAAKKPSRGRSFTFLLDPVTESNLDALIRNKPHLDKTAAIREAAHVAAKAIEGGKQ